MDDTVEVLELRIVSLESELQYYKDLRKIDYNYFFEGYAYGSQARKIHDAWEDSKFNKSNRN